MLFKETLPSALGLQTLHLLLARPDVGARDLPLLLATAAGWRLALNQAVGGAIGAVALAAIAWVIHRVWAPAAAAAPEALAR